VITIFLAGLATVVACGNSDDTTDKGNTAVAGGTTTTTGGTCTVPTTSCSLLTASEAATALAATSSTATSEITGPGDPSINEPATGSCAWVGPTSDEDGELVVDYACAETDFSASAEVNVIKALIGSGLGVAVSGVGDAAVWEETSSIAVSEASTIGGGILTAVAGDAYITLTLTGDGSPAELQARATAVAKLVVSRL
jgi:hypothetical protein